MVPILNVLTNRVAVKNTNAIVLFTGSLFILPFCSTIVASSFGAIFQKSTKLLRVLDSINKPFVSDNFLYYDPNECKWRLEDQQPCSNSDPSNVVSTTTLTTTEATTIADIESCEKLDAQWSCSSGTGRLLTLDYGPSELIAHLFLHNDLIPF